MDWQRGAYLLEFTLSRVSETRESVNSNDLFTASERKSPDFWPITTVYRHRSKMSVAKVAKTFGDSPCWPKLLASFATLVADTLQRPHHKFSLVARLDAASSHSVATNTPSQPKRAPIKAE